jgi:hypothetical protein
MAHINIKTQKNDDWFDQHDALKLGQSLDDLGKDFDASILLYPDSNDDHKLIQQFFSLTKVCSLDMNF